jgi:hypothetical protein
VLTWATRLSLAEQHAAAVAAASTERFDVTQLEKLYDALYLKHFGKRSRRKRSSRNDVLFGRLLTFFVMDDVDPETFISANMAMLHDSCVGSRYGFQPNMLSGERARARHNIFIRRANRRYKRGRSDVFDSSTDLGRFRTTLSESEADVARCFLTYDVSWSDAVSLAEPPDLWLAVRRGAHRCAYDLDQEKNLATLTAAVSVAEEFATGLSTRIGFDRWSWEGFRVLVRRLYPVPTSQPSLDLVGISGSAYGLAQ